MTVTSVSQMTMHIFRPFSRSWHITVCVCDKSNTTGSSGGAGTACLFEKPETTTVLWLESCCEMFSFRCDVVSPVVCLFGNCVVCPSSDSGFWLLLCYLPTFHVSTFCTFAINTTKRIRLVIFRLQKNPSKLQGTSFYKLTVNIYWYFSTLYITLTYNLSKRPCFIFNKQIIP